MSRHPRRILIVGNYGAGNLGDDAILGGIVEELRSLGFEGEIAVTHGGFKSSLEVYKGLKKAPFVPFGIRSRLNWRQRQAAKAAIQASDLVILGGGGLFTDAESWMAPLLWARQAAWCRKHKTPYICYGQSVGPLKSALSRWAAKKAFKHAQAVHVRGAQSAETLKALGFTEITVGTDAAFAFLAAHAKKAEKQPLLLCSLRYWPGVAQKEWQAILSAVKTFAEQKKLKPVLVAMDMRNQTELEALRATGLDLLELPSAQKSFEAMAKAQMAVTMRLHAGIFALSAGLPTLALSYSSKVQGLVNSLDASSGVKVLAPKQWTNQKIQAALEELSQQSLTWNQEALLAENQNFLRNNLGL